jgi:hypothetical protein
MKDDEKGGGSVSGGIRSELKILNSITPWSRVLLQKLTVSHVVKKFPAFY